MQAMFYKPSGKISPLFIVLYIVFLLIAIPILSVIYIYAIYYIPFIYLNFFIAIGCGAALGLTIMLAVKWGKVRNRLLVVLSTILAVILMKYVQWAVYIPLVYSDAYLMLQADFVELLLISVGLLIDPSSLLAFAMDINEYGVWAIGSSSAPVTGGLLLAVWIGEFLIMLACALVAATATGSTPFSEQANAWYKESKDELAATAPENPDTFKAGIEAGNFSELIHLVQNGVIDTSYYLGVSIFDPPPSSTTEPYYLTVTGIAVGVDRNGKANYKRKPLITNIAADYGTVAALRQPPVQQQPEFAQPEFAQQEFAQQEFAQQEFAQQQYTQPEFAQPEFAAPVYREMQQPEFTAPEYQAEQQPEFTPPEYQEPQQ